MKLIAILLSFCIMMNVLAASGTVKELERQLDEYHYVLAVEWDQKDQAFYKKQTDEFLAKVSDLIIKKGLTKEDILELSEKKMKNKQAFEAIKLKMTLLQKGATPEELAQALRESSKEFYANGASWIGGMDPILTGFIALFVIAIGCAVWRRATHECAEWGEQYVCETYMTCAGYYDASGSCLVYQEDQDCGYEDYCKRWVKKE